MDIFDIALNGLGIIFISILIVKYLISVNERFKHRVVGKMKKVALVFFLPYWVLIPSYLVFSYGVLAATDYMISSDYEVEQFDLTTFSQAKALLPGYWIHKEAISSNITQYNVLHFDEKGGMQFASHSNLEKAKKIVLQSTKGSWSLTETEEIRKKMISSNRFLVSFSFNNYNELLWVEINSSNSFLMGRDETYQDIVMEESGFFSFGGRIFKKEIN